MTGMHIKLHHEWMNEQTHEKVSVWMHERVSEWVNQYKSEWYAPFDYLDLSTSPIDL